MKKNPIKLDTIQAVKNWIKPWLQDETLGEDQKYVYIETARNNPDAVLKVRTHDNPKELIEYMKESQNVAMIFDLTSDETAILPNGDLTLDLFLSNERISGI